MREDVPGGGSQADAYLVSRSIRSFGSWYSTGYHIEDPFALLKYVKEAKPTPQCTATVADVASLLVVCAATCVVSEQALITLLAATRMRRTESPTWCGRTSSSPLVWSQFRAPRTEGR